MTAGRVGKPHGLDGSFYVDGPRHALPEGTDLTVRDRVHRIARRGGTDERPLIRLEGIEDARALRGALLLVEDELADDEWLASDLVGCLVRGLPHPEPAAAPTVTRVIDGPSCSILELEDGTLIPFVKDAIAAIDTESREIRVDQEFLG